MVEVFEKYEIALNNLIEKAKIKLKKDNNIDCLEEFAKSVNCIYDLETSDGMFTLVEHNLLLVATSVKEEYINIDLNEELKATSVSIIDNYSNATYEMNFEKKSIHIIQELTNIQNQMLEDLKRLVEENLFQEKLKEF